MHMLCTGGNSLWIAYERRGFDGPSQSLSVAMYPRMGTKGEALHLRVTRPIGGPTRPSQHFHEWVTLAEPRQNPGSTEYGPGRVRPADEHGGPISPNFGEDVWMAVCRSDTS